LPGTHLLLDDQADGLGEPLPLVELTGELAAPSGGDRVIAGAAVVLGRPPGAVDVTAVLEPLERRVERSLIDVEAPLGHLLDPGADAPAVHGLERQRLEDEEVDA